MKERFLPRAVGLVAPDDVVAGLCGAGASLGQIGHLEGDVMDPAPAGGEEPVQEPVGAQRLEHLDGGAGGERPGGPPKGPGRPTLVGHAAEHGDQGGGSIRDTRKGNGDMIEADRGHRRLIHLNRKPCCIGRTPSHIPMDGRRER
jgi:hypothetical protein